MRRAASTSHRTKVEEMRRAASTSHRTKVEEMKRGDLIMKEKDFVMLERLVDGKFTITSYRLFYGDDCTMCNNTFERIDFDGILNIIPY